MLSFLLQLEAAKADAVRVQGDITYRNTRIDEVKLVPQLSTLGLRYFVIDAERVLLLDSLTVQPVVQTMIVLQAETKWTAAATQLEALTKTHDGVLGQLREAQDRSALAEQETIEVSARCTCESVSHVTAGSCCCSNLQLLLATHPSVHIGDTPGTSSTTKPHV